MTHTLEYHDDHYESLRETNTSVLKEYEENMLVYLSHQFPQFEETRLRNFIHRHVENVVVPEAGYIVNEGKGDLRIIEKGKLDEYMTRADKFIRSPFGAAYCYSTDQPSVFRPIILDKQAARKKVKAEEIIAEARNEKDVAMIKGSEQLNIKIEINIYSGVMLSGVAFRSAIHYNAITSTARYGTMSGYAFTERFLASNFYFESEDHGINWFINLLREYPGEETMTSIMSEYSLQHVSEKVLIEAINEAVSTYTRFSKNVYITSLMCSLSPNQRAYAYYASNFYRICFLNQHIADMVSDIADTSDLKPYDGDVVSIFDLPDGLISTLVVTLLGDAFKSKDGKTITRDRIDKEFPKLGNRIKALYFRIDAKLKKFEKLFQVFINHSILPANAISHKSMKRECVVLSDTDSIIFTLIKWTTHFTKSSDLSKEAYMVAAVLIMFLSKGYSHLFTMMLMRMGVPKEDMHRLVMKNEYTFSALLRTVIAKHYAGYVDIREGQILDPPKFDLKGRGFKGSSLSQETVDKINDIIKYILDTAIANKNLTYHDLLLKVIEFEQEILASVRRGESTYLETLSIKLETEYAKPDSSSFVYHQLWEDMFSKKYGHSVLPQRCKVVLIKKLNASTFKHFFTDPDALAGLRKFFIKYPKKHLIRLFVPVEAELPDAIKPLLDDERIVDFNCFSLKLILKSFNIVHEGMLSSVYPGLVQELTNTNKEITP